MEWYGKDRFGAIGVPTTHVAGIPVDREFLAKMVYAEAGGQTWTCQILTCSAILNLCEGLQESLDKAGHNKSIFSTAPYVDKIEPDERTYAIVDYVLSGGRIEGIYYFRTGRYHDFGKPVCSVGNSYFSTVKKGEYI